jgi:hypothetical protein
VRIDRGGEVMAPGTPNDPVQFIDARDLAEWTIRMAEQGATGIYNATGPDYNLTIGKMLEDIKTGIKSNAKFTWVSADFLATQKVRGWSDMPVWVAPRPQNLGFAQISIKKALSKGLTFRSVGNTAQATLEWFKKQPAERQAKMKAGLSPHERPRSWRPGMPHRSRKLFGVPPSGGRVNAGLRTSGLEQKEKGGSNFGSAFLFSGLPVTDQCGDVLSEAMFE